MSDHTKCYMQEASAVYMCNPTQEDTNVWTRVTVHSLTLPKSSDMSCPSISLSQVSMSSVFLMNCCCWLASFSLLPVGI